MLPGEQVSVMVRSLVLVFGGYPEQIPFVLEKTRFLLNARDWPDSDLWKIVKELGTFLDEVISLKSKLVRELIGHETDGNLLRIIEGTHSDQIMAEGIRILSWIVRKENRQRFKKALVRIIKEKDINPDLCIKAACVLYGIGKPQGNNKHIERILSQRLKTDDDENVRVICARNLELWASPADSANIPFGSGIDALFFAAKNDLSIKVRSMAYSTLRFKGADL